MTQTRREFLKPSAALSMLLSHPALAARQRDNSRGLVQDTKLDRNFALKILGLLALAKVETGFDNLPGDPRYNELKRLNLQECLKK